MSKFIAKAKPFEGRRLEEGQHVVVVSRIAEVDPSHAAEMPWKDVTPQIEVTVKNDTGSIKKWFNLKGFLNIDDCPNGKAPKGCEFMSSEGHNEQYVVDSKTKMRKENTDKTETAVAGFLDFAVQCGIDEGEEFEIADLEGRSVGVVVIEGDNGNEVHYFTTPERIKSVDEVEA